MTKNIMYVFGIVFIVIGILGFIQGDSVLGIFAVDTLHNIVHLASGVLALVFASQGEAAARKFALILGIVYALVTVLGFLVGGDKLLGLITINSADNYLHLLLAVVLIVVGLRKTANTMTTPSM